MRERLADFGGPRPDRMYMAYAVGHALERRRDFAGSFAAYKEGARLFRISIETLARVTTSRNFSSAFGRGSASSPRRCWRAARRATGKRAPRHSS